MRSLSLPLVSCLLLTSFANAQPLVPTFANVSYGGDPNQVMDVYLAPSSLPSAALIEIHGGGWWQGDKSQFDFYLHDANGIGMVEKAFARGISVISIQYRLVDATVNPIQNPFPTGNLDVVRAIQFVRARSTLWNIDPERVGAIGRSAGGHLALWAALSADFADPGASHPVERESSRLLAVASCWAPTDCTPTGLLCTPTRLALCWYMGVGDPALMPQVPTADLLAASPTWLAQNGAGPALNREVSLLNLYHGNPAATSSSQLVSPTDDPHALVFSFLIQEALVAIGNQDVQSFHDWDLNTVQPAATDAAADFLDDRLHRPLLFVSPEPGGAYNPSQFAPTLRVNLGGTTTNKYLNSIAANPQQNQLYVVVGSQSLSPLILDLSLLSLFSQFGLLSIQAGVNQLSIAFAAFDLAALGANPWLMLAVRKDGTIWSKTKAY